MNILFYIEGLNFGGQQTFWLNVFSNIQSRNFNLFVGVVRESQTLFDEYKKVSKKIIKIGDQSTDLKFGLESIPKVIKQSISLRKVITENEIDIIACNGTFTFVSAVVTSYLCNVHLVRFIGGDLRKHEKSLFKSRALELVYRRPKKYFGYRFMYNELAKKGVKKSQLAVDFSGMAVDHNLFRPEEKDQRVIIRGESRISIDDLVLGWVGRISPDMEIFETIRLFVEVARRINTIKLIIVGDGPSKSEIVSWVTSEGLIDRVIFAGYVPYKDVYLWYQKMDIVPLLDTDPHGGSILREAMSCGVVPLTVNGSSRTQEDFIDHGVNGILIPPENFLQTAVKWLEKLDSDRNFLLELQHRARLKAVERLNFKSLANVFESEIQIIE